MNRRSQQRAVFIDQFREALEVASGVCIDRCLKPEHETLKDIEKVCLSKCFDRSFEYKFQFLGKYAEAITRMKKESMGANQQFQVGVKTHEAQ